jgi:signal transduction histidine kinase
VSTSAVVAGAYFWIRYARAARTLEALRRGLKEEVEARTTALHIAQAALARTEKLAAVGQFAAGVAHQVSNPLAALRASLAFLEEARASDPADARAVIADAKEALARICAVTRRLRDASRLASAPSRPGAATQLSAAVGEAIALARSSLGPAGSAVEVAVDVPEGLWAGAERDLVVEVVANLLANAIEATADRAGRVRVTGHAEGGTVRVCVEDDGGGMAPEVLAHVFEPFFSTKKDPSATGLGLAVSRGLVASAGGDLTLDSAPGRGTRARVELPSGAPPRGTERE